jgi:hypothetical protein
MFNTLLKWALQSDDKEDSPSWMVSEEEHIYCQSSSLSMGKTVNSLFFQYGTKILHISETINYATRAQSITELGI